MGTPSDVRRRKRRPRPGKRERARVKKHRRGSTTVFVGGAGSATLKAGRKKWQEAVRSHKAGNPFSWDRYESKPQTHLDGEPISKAGKQEGRPPY
jgi:hypothetical protein